MCEGIEAQGRAKDGAGVGAAGSLRVFLSDGTDIYCDAVVESVGRTPETDAVGGLGIKMSEKGYI
jgi:pyruvate/2-oxoglutarate dehydrogenase complex dihydrolipoamide dehydrogenase (E3) component